MSMNSIHRAWAGCAVIALAALASSAACADVPADQKDASPVVVAQASTPGAHAPQAALPASAFPAHERGVRQAAVENNEALRRYTWRTRMIYNFYYNDFARKE
jgi:hypothetical protein